MVGVLIQTMPMLLFSVHRLFVLVGGDVPGVPPLSRVDSPVSSKDRARAKHFARVPALEGALTCHLCPCRACFHGISMERFPLGALCLSARCVFTCPVGDRGAGQLPGADLQAAGPSRLLWKRCQSQPAVLCLPSGNPVGTGNAEKGG